MKHVFIIEAEDMEKIEAFMKEVEAERSDNDQGAIGGATTYHFTPTGIGMGIQVTHFGVTRDFSDSENW